MLFFSCSLSLPLFLPPPSYYQSAMQLCTQNYFSPENVTLIVILSNARPQYLTTGYLSPFFSILMIFAVFFVSLSAAPSLFLFPIFPFSCFTQSIDCTVSIQLETHNDDQSIFHRDERNLINVLWSSRIYYWDERYEYNTITKTQLFIEYVYSMRCITSSLCLNMINNEYLLPMKSCTET